MASCRHHSGYLADDEAGHSTLSAQVQPKKPLLPEMGPASKLSRVPYPPTMSDSSAHQGHRPDPKCPQAFGSFLDFLTQGQVLDSLQSVVEEATERLAAMKTDAGVPLVEVKDPVEVPSGARRVRPRPSFNTVHRHRARPTLCTGDPNNYPSCSSSMSDSHSSLKVGCLGSHNRDSELGAQGLGSLPPMKDTLLLEKSLKRLQRLENKGRVLTQPNSQRNSLLWDSLDSQTSSQWTQEQPLSWFSGLLGSCPGTPSASELGPGERELMFLKREFNREMKSLLSQPASFDLPGYCSLREPYHTLDFLAKHHLFPALHNVVSQAVDKLSGARRHDGCPLFPATEPNVPVNHLRQPDSKLVTPKEGEEPYNSLPTTASSPKMFWRKNKSRRGSPTMSNAQMATRFRLKSSNNRFTKKKPLPSILSKSSMSHVSNPWYEELINFLIERAVSLLLCKHKFEDGLNKQLGFISFPVTETLMDIILGFKKVKGSHICLSSNIDWSCLLEKLEKAELERPVSKQTSQTAATAQGDASGQNTESPSTQLELATDSNQDQTTESHQSLYTESPIHPLPSPQESTTVEEQIPTNLPEPKLSVFSIINMGSSSHKSKEMVEDEDEDEVEDEDEDEVEEKDKESYEYLSEYLNPLKPESEGLISPSVDTVHSDPP
uniref:Coiled-coil domain-containing protein 116 n=1 Tax=Castor canadensis TaxID=51338 RepID=A0A8B7UAD7_CASCN|nr:coiled-coil domain-containing protein 116 [Castor canadensis]